MSEVANRFAGISGGGQRLLEKALENQSISRDPQLGIFHYLQALIARHPEMTKDLIGLDDLGGLVDDLRTKASSGEAGPPLQMEEVVQQARKKARVRGKGQASERDIALVILSAANLWVVEVDGAGRPAEASAPVAQEPERRDAISVKVRSTATLERFGVDLTLKARQGQLSRIVGRDEELDLMIETLCRRTKRNPILIGHAGVGKTAIVEALAQRIAEGKLPPVLQNVDLWMIQSSAIVAGTQMMGELDKRMKALLDEAAQDGILLFIDEVHTIVGAGGQAGVSDVSSHLKPALARGEIACIAATTDNEYRRFIEQDKALERRFLPVKVQELGVNETLQVLETIRVELQGRSSVEVQDEVLPWLVEFAEARMRNRYFPDKAVDLLEQCVAHAVAKRLTAVDRSIAEAVALRMVGVPQDLDMRIAQLEAALMRMGVLEETVVDEFINRLGLTMRGLDLRSERPNAVLFLVGSAADHVEDVAGTIAESFLGSSDRQVGVELSRMTTHYDVSLLLGSAPGYIGYSDEIPIHKVAQSPWCVLRLENITECHPAVQQVIAQALDDGFFTDSQGKHVFLSDSIVVVTGSIPIEASARMGFGTDDAEPDWNLRAVAARILGSHLADQFDFVFAGKHPADTKEDGWLAGELLEQLTQRYAKEGIHLTFDASVSEWLQNQRALVHSRRDWERLIEPEIGHLLADRVTKMDKRSGVRLVISAAHGKLVAAEEFEI